VEWNAEIEDFFGRICRNRVGIGKPALAIAVFENHFSAGQVQETFRKTHFYMMAAAPFSKVKHIPSCRKFIDAAVEEPDEVAFEYDVILEDDGGTVRLSGNAAVAFKMEEIDLDFSFCQGALFVPSVPGERGRIA
jgi:hypothetical protein